MKSFEGQKKYFAWGFTAFIVFLACLGAYYLVFHLDNVFGFFDGLIQFSIPIVDGILIAYFLSPLINGIEKFVVVPVCKKLNVKVNAKSRGKLRAVSIILSFAVMILVAYFLFSLIIPQMILSVYYIGQRLNDYQESLMNFVTNFLSSRPELEAQIDQMLENATDMLSDLYKQYLNFRTLTDLTQVSFFQAMAMGVVGFFKSIWNFGIGMIISVYVLYSKEIFSSQAKKLLFAFLAQKDASLVIQGARTAHKTFVGFIVGKLVDSLIIGIICFITVTILGMPFSVLISVIIGVTNIIPFFGPFLGAIPCLFLIFVENPMQCPVFLVAIFLIQQFDGNILGPKILGDSTGLPSFWVIFAITFFGGLWGIMGMFVGTPTFAVIYKFVRFVSNRFLEKKNMPLQTNAYRDLSQKEEGAYLIYTPIPEPEEETEEKKPEKKKKTD